MNILRIIFATVSVAVLPAITSAENIEVFPLEWDFGNVEVGTTESKTFEITGAGVFFDSEISAIEISNDLFGVYSLFDAPPHGTSVAPGDIVQFDVRFSPTMTGDFTSTLEIASSDLRWPDLDIPLRGRGISGIVPEPASLLIWSILGLGLTNVRRRKPV